MDRIKDLQAEPEIERHPDYAMCFSATGEPDEEVYDDGTSHITRNGKRYCFSCQETITDSVMDRLNKKYAKFVDNQLKK